MNGGQKGEVRQEARRKVEARTRIVALGTENRALFQEGHGQDLTTAALWEVRVRERNSRENSRALGCGRGCYPLRLEN